MGGSSSKENQEALKKLQEYQAQNQQAAAGQA